MLLSCQEPIAAYLETKPLPPYGNLGRADELRAATDVCLRWGSCFALLADPARPASPGIALLFSDFMEVRGEFPVEEC